MNSSVYNADTGSTVDLEDNGSILVTNKDKRLALAEAHTVAAAFEQILGLRDDQDSCTYTEVRLLGLLAPEQPFQVRVSFDSPDAKDIGSSAFVLVKVAIFGDPPEDPHVAFATIKISLIHSEASEALEEIRAGNMHSAETLAELADILIRVCELAAYIEDTSRGRYLLPDFGEIVEAKMAKNEKRPYRHGGKLF